MLEALKERVNEDVGLVRRGRYAHHDIPACNPATLPG